MTGVPRSQPGSEEAAARVIAFKILGRHPNCLQDDEPLDDLIEEIAQAIVRSPPVAQREAEGVNLPVVDSRDGINIAIVKVPPGYANAEEFAKDCGFELAAVTRAAPPSRLDAGSAEAFQPRVLPWMLECFGPVIPFDRVERNHRFLEEALELVQACGCTQNESHQLVDYVYGRDQGDINQEVGGVMVTLAALCIANGFDMHGAGETELARIWTKVEQIRAKQAAKPKHSPLPAVTPPAVPAGEERRAPGSKPSTLTAKEIADIRSAFSYDPETGVVSRIWNAPGRDRKLGPITHTDTAGYISCIIVKKRYSGHRVAWLLAHGAWPAGEIDHINGDPLDNRLVNLRLATPSQNKWNVQRGTKNRSGYKGVKKAKSGRFEANIKQFNKRFYLGTFDTAEEAHQAYCEEAKRRFGEFANDGFRALSPSSNGKPATENEG